MSKLIQAIEAKLCTDVEIYDKQEFQLFLGLWVMNNKQEDIRNLLGEFA